MQSEGPCRQDILMTFWVQAITLPLSNCTLDQFAHAWSRLPTEGLYQLLSDAALNLAAL